MNDPSFWQALDRKRLNLPLVFLVLSLLTLGLFFRHVSSSATLLSSPSSLAVLLASPQDQPYLWQNHLWSSMKYRVLFYHIVQTTAKCIHSQDASVFYWTFTGWSFVLTSGTLLAFWVWLGLLGFSNRQRFLGCLVCLLSFPVLFAYDYPVFTREDPLAYLLVVLSLIAGLNHNPLWFMLFSTLGAMTRETTLVVSACYVLRGPGRFRSRVLYAFPSVAALVLLRLSLGYESYNPLTPARVNLARPLETAFFLFLTFGVFWLLALLRWGELWPVRASLSVHRRTLYTWTPLAAVLVLTANFVLAVVRENRISFLLFPFIIPWGIDWVSAHSKDLRAFGRSRLLCIAWVLLTLGAGVLSQLALASPGWLAWVPDSVQTRLIGGHTTLATLLGSYSDIRVWAFYLIVQCSLVLLVVAVSVSSGPFHLRPGARAVAHANRRCRDAVDRTTGSG
jgi:hypothetical protein